MGIFSRGFEAMKKNEQKFKAGDNSIWRLFLTDDGEEAPIVFLNEQPVNFYEHSVQKRKNGKEVFENIICTGIDCDLCDNGSRPSPKSAWLVIDKRERSYTDKEGKEVNINQQIKLLVQGTKFASVCDRMSSKYGLVDREWTLVRMGKGKQTSYTLERGDNLDIDFEEVQQLLPSHLRELYDGTEESIMDIIEKVLMPDTVDNDYEDDFDESISSGEETAPKSKLKIGRKQIPPRPVERQVKPSIKSMLKKKK